MITPKAGFYSKDVAPAIASAPPRQMTTGLAPWLRQAKGGGRPAPVSMGTAGAPSSGEPWYAAQLAGINSSNAAATQAMLEQKRQADLLRNQQWLDQVPADVGGGTYTIMDQSGSPMYVGEDYLRQQGFTNFNEPPDRSWDSGSGD